MTKTAENFVNFIENAKGLEVEDVWDNGDTFSVEIGFNGDIQPKSTYERVHALVRQFNEKTDEKIKPFKVTHPTRDTWGYTLRVQFKVLPKGVQDALVSVPAKESEDGYYFELFNGDIVEFEEGKYFYDVDRPADIYTVPEAYNDFVKFIAKAVPVERIPEAQRDIVFDHLSYKDGDTIYTDARAAKFGDPRNAYYLLPENPDENDMRDFLNEHDEWYREVTEDELVVEEDDGEDFEYRPEDYWQ